MAQTSIGIGQAWMNSLLKYAEGLQKATLQEAEEAVTAFHGAVVERARITPGWSDLADNIQVWSEDGRLYIGVNNTDLVSQAFALEYGDEERPPVALLRSLSEEVRGVGQKAVQTSSNVGYGKTT